MKCYTHLLWNVAGNLVAIHSTNYLQHTSKMVSADELSIVNTSVRASQSLSLLSVKAAEKGAWKRKMKKERSVPCAYLRTMHACARSASHNATTCGLVKCGFGRLKARVIFGDTSHKTLVWARTDGRSC